MTNKTDNDALITQLRKQVNWMDGTQVIIDMCSNAADALQAAQETIDEQKETIKALMNGLDDFGGTTPVLLHISRLETKLAAIRDAVKHPNGDIAVVAIEKILNTTNAQPKKDVIADFVNSQQEVPIEIQAAIFSNIDKLIDESNAQPAQEQGGKE